MIHLKSTTSNPHIAFSCVPFVSRVYLIQASHAVYVACLVYLFHKFTGANTSVCRKNVLLKVSSCGEPSHAEVLAVVVTLPNRGSRYSEKAEVGQNES